MTLCKGALFFPFIKPEKWSPPPPPPHPSTTNKPNCHPAVFPPGVGGREAVPPSLAVMSPGEPQALPPCLLAPFTILSHRAALFFCSRESCSGAGRAPGLPPSGVLSPALWGKEQSETRDVMPACAQGSKSCSRQGHLVGCIPLAHQKPCIFGAASGWGGGE